jgi:hypothetical protein
MKTFNMMHKEVSMWKRGRVMFDSRNFDPRSGDGHVRETDSTRLSFWLTLLSQARRLQSDTLEAAGTTRSDHHLYPTTLILF